MAPDTGEMKTKQTLPASGMETDENGQPVAINADNAEWSVDDTSIATVEENPDGSATFTSVAAGSTVVRLKDNVSGVEGTRTLTVTKRANQLAIVFGDPKDATV